MSQSASGPSTSPPEKNFFERVVIWLHFLRVVPDDHTKFDKAISDLTENYRALVNDHGLTNWHLIYCSRSSRMDPKEMPEDADLMRAIHEDVIRTVKPIVFLRCDETDTAHPDDVLGPFNGHMRRLERILYIFAKCNLSIRYMQGFNELVVPIYYVLTQGMTTDLDSEEAMAFFTLQRLITATSLGEMYNVREDGKVAFQKMDEFEALLSKHLPELAEDLRKFEIPPMQYAYRWLILLFGQEYDLPNLILVWDEMIDHGSELMDFAYYVGIAQLMELQDDVLHAEDQSAKLQRLQGCRLDAVPRVLNNARRMWDEDRRKQPGGDVKEGQKHKHKKKQKKKA